MYLFPNTNISNKIGKDRIIKVLLIIVAITSYLEIWFWSNIFSGMHILFLYFYFNRLDNKAPNIFNNLGSYVSVTYSPAYIHVIWYWYLYGVLNISNPQSLGLEEKVSWHLSYIEKVELLLKSLRFDMTIVISKGEFSFSSSSFCLQLKMP